MPLNRSRTLKFYMRAPDNLAPNYTNNFSELIDKKGEDRIEREFLFYIYSKIFVDQSGIDVKKMAI